MKKKDYPHVSAPERSALALYLICEELKSRKFFSGLQRLGLDYCFYQPHLDKPILAAAGLEESDEVYKFYFRLIERCSRKLREEDESVTRQARRVWDALVRERERRMTPPKKAKRRT